MLFESPEAMSSAGAFCEMQALKEAENAALDFLPTFLAIGRRRLAAGDAMKKVGPRPG